MRRLLSSLALAAGGMAVLLAGLVWDAVLHTRDSTLAGREGVFTLSNPGHLLLAAGIAVTLVGIVASIDGALLLRDTAGWRANRLRAVSGALTVVVAAGAASAGVWATTQGHDHHDGEASTAPAAPPAAIAAAATAETAGQDLGSSGHDHGSTGAAASVTPAQQAAADKLRADTVAATARFADLSAARAAGYYPMTPLFQGIQHWHNQAFNTDGKVLDPTRPEELIYASARTGMKLIGAMFLMPEVGQSGPQPGGALTQWHAHDNLCFGGDPPSVVGIVSTITGQCPPGSVNYQTPEMLHVWLIDNPDGPFSKDMNPSALAAAVANS